MWTWLEWRAERFDHVLKPNQNDSHTTAPHDTRNVFSFLKTKARRLAWRGWSLLITSTWRTSKAHAELTFLIIPTFFLSSTTNYLDFTLAENTYSNKNFRLRYRPTAIWRFDGHLFVSTFILYSNRFGYIFDRQEILVNLVHMLVAILLVAIPKSVADHRPLTATHKTHRHLVLADDETHKASTVVSRHCLTPMVKLNSLNIHGK